jgi:hypothetical protein
LYEQAKERGEMNVEAGGDHSSQTLAYIHIPRLFKEVALNMRRPSKRSGKAVKLDASFEHDVVVADVRRPW